MSVIPFQLPARGEPTVREEPNNYLEAIECIRVLEGRFRSSFELKLHDSQCASATIAIKFESGEDIEALIIKYSDGTFSICLKGEQPNEGLTLERTLGMLIRHRIIEPILADSVA
jgi:hypothetical protein